MSKKTVLMIAIIGLILSVVTIITCLAIEFNKDKNIKDPVTDPTETTQTEDIEINDSDINIEIENHEKYGEIQFIYGITSSIEKIMNGKPATGDKVIINGYQYTYNIIYADLHTHVAVDYHGWSVYSIDKNRKVAEGIEEELFGIPVKSMNYCYKGCEKLETVKEIPKTIESATGAFESCAKLKECCELPEGLTDARNMFAYCTNLMKAPALPNTIQTIDRMFYYCRALSGNVNIPDSVETFNEIFSKTQNDIIVEGNAEIIDVLTRQFWNVSKK